MQANGSACSVGADDGLDARNRSEVPLRCWLQLLSEDEAVVEAARWEGAEAFASAALRAAIAAVYAAVCALGLVGNALALCVLRRAARHGGARRSSVNCFVMGLAATDLQFVLTLPFWAADTALDFRWPFGKLMCKLVSSVTTMNMYASVFFLTAMSVTRYCALASPLPLRAVDACGGGGGGGAAGGARRACVAIWLVSLTATLPHAVYSTTVRVMDDDELCLVRFPDTGGWNPQQLLGLYQTQKVLVGFLVPLIVICACYVLLLRVVLRRRVSSGSEERVSSRRRRRSRVTRSVTVVVLSFFVCWLPNQALTLWGVLIKFDLVPFTKAFYNAQVYAFPLTVCLAHANSCLNPVLYCLVRREYRAGLKQLLLGTFARLARRGKKVAEAPKSSTQGLAVVRVEGGL
ncbi:relaxin-3 receptor 1-like [Hoplias malabaricus]|uniref:relaxin-3 receptor 1-like n=1 Tax=Hoplias malabaricus TaxID=27720 RepID=UPI003463126B